jgi:2-polyprenyl-3-methyl-5-hydroxy-6-metoxy-1,4-benzoquinol methylase
MRCGLCGIDDARQWKTRTSNRPLTADDLQITDTRYGVTLALWQCRRCGFIFADSTDLDTLATLYEQLADPAYLESQQGRARQMQWLLEQVLRAKPDARTLLDVGAGSGVLVAEAQRHNLVATGVEPSRSLVDGAQRAHGVALLQGAFPHPQLAGQTFDVTCLIDVIEHVTDPLQMLQHCAATLNPSGVLVVVTPDVDSLPARLMGNHWWHYRMAHVSYFSRRTMHRAAAEAGLSPIVDISAKWFFTVDYIAKRLTRYLAIGQLNRLARRHSLLRRVYEQMVPLNLHDSMLVVLRRGPSSRDTQ